MKHLIRIIPTLIVFLVVLFITIFVDAIILRQGMLHHPYLPGISLWIDRAFLIITLAIPFVATFWFYRYIISKKVRKPTERGTNYEPYQNKW